MILFSTWCLHFDKRFATFMNSSLKSTIVALVIIFGTGISAFAETGGKDIVDTAAASGKFSILVQALQTTGLNKVLKEKGPFTIFAPDDAAFAKIPSTALNDILGNKARLANLLKFHIVRANVDPREAARVGTVQTLEGDVLTLQQDGKNLKVESATVTQPDIPCKNGIIYVVDTVLQPTDKLQ
jgi:uncharacterized surface protein with fasciclin (FAS1) repeats